VIQKILKLKLNDVFLDIGHGIGLLCLQAAYTAGCQARGIELVFGRHAVAQVFCESLKCQNEQHPDRPAGVVLLRHGSLEDVAHRSFLVEGVTRVFFNNFNGVFGERSEMKGKTPWFLDDYVAGLFANMQPGSILVSLHPLRLGRTRNQVNMDREKLKSRANKNSSMEENEDKNASFFDMDEIVLGKACDTVKWRQESGCQNRIILYKYTRLEQPAGRAVFLCSNPDCRHARDRTLIDATKEIGIGDGGGGGRWVINHCICGVEKKNTRSQTCKSYLQ
jgi:hypothetical protein